MSCTAPLPRGSGSRADTSWPCASGSADPESLAVCSSNATSANPIRFVHVNVSPCKQVLSTACREFGAPNTQPSVSRAWTTHQIMQHLHCGDFVSADM